jgi:hypothetical protein
MLAEKFNSQGHNQDVIEFIGIVVLLLVVLENLHISHNFNPSELNKHVSEASKWDLTAASAQLAFWEQLLLPTPNLDVLISLSRNINESIASANEAYQRIFKLRAGVESPLYLRMYAAFLSDVICDDKRAASAWEQAQSCEESIKSSMSDFCQIFVIFLMHQYLI